MYSLRVYVTINIITILPYKNSVTEVEQFQSAAYKFYYTGTLTKYLKITILVVRLV